MVQVCRVAGMVLANKYAVDMLPKNEQRGDMLLQG